MLGGNGCGVGHGEVVWVWSVWILLYLGTDTPKRSGEGGWLGWLVLLRKSVSTVLALLQGF